MTTQEEIAAIQESQYNGFRGKKLELLKVVHEKLREKIGDEQYLEYLKLKMKDGRKPIFDTSKYKR